MIAHLWQSTVFAVAAWLLTLAVRNNRAKVRHALWLAASIKFLLPFSLLVNMGSRIEWPAAHETADPVVPAAVQQIGQTLATIQIPEIAPANHLPLILWFCGSALVFLVWCERWRRMSAMVRNSEPVTGGRVKGVSRVRAGARMGPGIFGIFHPILLLPKGVADHLTDAQMDAIIAHELCHIRRRDNLTAAIHMLVEAVFWFHPLVWWIGTRLTDERERACDEEVLRLGTQPEVYAEGILTICKLYLESPLPCTAGVTGANLRTRIEEIMTRRIAAGLHPVKKLLLATAAALALTLPLAIGLAQSAPEGIEVASIKPNHSGPGPLRGPRFQPGGTMTATAVTLDDLIQWAFNLRDNQISGGPEWMRSATYDITAKPEQAWGPGFDNRERGRRMTQTLLKERFQFIFRVETKELPVYTLAPAKDGVKLKESGSAAKPADMWMRGGRGRMIAHAIPAAILAEALSEILRSLGR